MLGKHTFDTNNNKKQHHKHPKANNKKEDKEDKYSTTILFAQMEGRFYCCGKMGHKSPNCRTKEKIPKYEWARNKAQQHVQTKK